MKYLGITWLGETVALRLYNYKKEMLNNYFIQFTFKDIWWYPHKENRYDNGSWICGWLVFYFGNIIAKQRGKLL